MSSPLGSTIWRWAQVAEVPKGALKSVNRWTTQLVIAGDLDADSLGQVLLGEARRAGFRFDQQWQCIE